MIALDFFLENQASCTIFVRSGLKDIFHCCAHLFIFSRSLLRFAVVSLTLSTTENRNVLSGKSLASQRSSEEDHLCKYQIYVRNKNQTFSFLVKTFPG